MKSLFHVLVLVLLMALPAPAAYDFTAASSQFISGTLGSSTTTPITIAAWFRTSSTTNVALGAFETGVTARHNVFIIGSGGGVNAGSVNSAGSAGSATSTTGFTSGAWSHAAAVYTSATSRTAYCNGTGASTNTTNIDPGSVSLLKIGARTTGSVTGAFFQGSIAEFGVWNIALSAADVAALAAGFSPRHVRPQSLIFYAPLMNNLTDRRGGVALTNNNGATTTAHPRQYASFQPGSGPALLAFSCPKLRAVLPRRRLIA